MFLRNMVVTSNFRATTRDHGLYGLCIMIISRTLIKFDHFCQNSHFVAQDFNLDLT